MPRRNDIQKILVIGSGPIVIGQSAEFDYSGTQACKALKQEGYEVVLVNSNPATIMTDPDLADRTYIEPLTRDYVEEIIRQEVAMLGPGSGKFALLPTVGGQTALNLAVDLADAGILDRYNVELIGAKLEAIKKAEDRLLFKDAMIRIGLEVSKSALVNNLRDGLDFASKLGFPVLIRPSFTLGGSGGGIAYNREELMEILARGLVQAVGAVVPHAVVDQVGRGVSAAIGKGARRDHARVRDLKMHGVVAVNSGKAGVGGGAGGRVGLYIVDFSVREGGVHVSIRRPGGIPGIGMAVLRVAAGEGDSLHLFRGRKGNSHRGLGGPGFRVGRAGAALRRGRK